MNYIEKAQEILPTIAERAAKFDEMDTFVAENYVLLKQHGLV